MSPLLQIKGNWPEDPLAIAHYVGRSEDTGEPDPACVKIAPEGWRFVRGSVSVLARFEKGCPDSQARIVIGYDPKDGSYVCAGVGGYNAAYVIDEWKPVPGVLSPIWVSGQPLGSPEPRDMRVELRFEGRKLDLLVDGARVMSRQLTRTIGGGGLGLFAWGHETITFSEFTISTKPALAVVVMPFAEFEDVYHDLIRPALEGAGLRVERLDEHATPQGILEDIRQTIRDADLVVAEITPDNANVFYEVGYAYASQAPTLLLVREGRKLPFDVAPERCIRYDDSDVSRAAATERLVQAIEELGLAGPGE